MKTGVSWCVHVRILVSPLVLVSRCVKLRLLSEPGELRRALAFWSASSFQSSNSDVVRLHSSAMAEEKEETQDSPRPARSCSRPAFEGGMKET